MTITKQVLSNSTNGKQILIASATSASATTIHTAVTGSTALDEVYLYAINNATASMTCSILWGPTEPDDLMRVVINPNTGRTLMIDGKILNNANTIRAYASVAGLMCIDGFVNRIV